MGLHSVVPSCGIIPLVRNSFLSPCCCFEMHLIASGRPQDYEEVGIETAEGEGLAIRFLLRQGFLLCVNRKSAALLNVAEEKFGKLSLVCGNTECPSASSGRNICVLSNARRGGRIWRRVLRFRDSLPCCPSKPSFILSSPSRHLVEHVGRGQATYRILDCLADAMCSSD